MQAADGAYITALELKLAKLFPSLALHDGELAFGVEGAGRGFGLEPFVKREIGHHINFIGFVGNAC